MNVNELVQIGIYFGLLIALTPLLGGYMARVFKGERTWLSPVLVPLEKLIYRLGGTAPDEEMSWRRFFWAVLIFNVLGVLSLMALQMTQAHLPLNPQQFPNVPWALALPVWPEREQRGFPGSAGGLGTPEPGRWP